MPLTWPIGSDFGKAGLPPSSDTEAIMAPIARLLTDDQIAVCLPISESLNASAAGTPMIPIPSRRCSRCWPSAAAMGNQR